MILVVSPGSEGEIRNFFPNCSWRPLTCCQRELTARCIRWSAHPSAFSTHSPQTQGSLLFSAQRARSLVAKSCWGSGHWAKLKGPRPGGHLEMTAAHRGRGRAGAPERRVTPRPPWGSGPGARGSIPSLRLWAEDKERTRVGVAARG